MTELPAPQESLGAKDRRPGTSSVESSLDHDLQRLWKDVFDRSRVVAARALHSTPWPERAAAPGLPRDLGAGPRHGEPAAPTPSPGDATGRMRVARYMAPAGAAGPSETRSANQCVLPVRLPVNQVPDAPARIDPSGSRAVGDALPVGGATPPTNRGPASSVAPPMHAATSVCTMLKPQTANRAPLPGPSRTPSAGQDDVLDESFANAATPLRDDPEARVAADEVVRVHHDGETVAIAVRDRGLAQDTAVRCAMEIARTLTGDSKRLRTLTLNGKRIFERCPRDSSAAPSGASVLFTC